VAVALPVAVCWPALGPRCGRLAPSPTPTPASPCLSRAQALLNCVRTTLTAIRRRAHSRSNSVQVVIISQPFFRVNISVNIATGNVDITPSLTVVQVRTPLCAGCLPSLVGAHSHTPPPIAAPSQPSPSHSLPPPPSHTHIWLSIPSGFLVVFEKPSRSSFTFYIYMHDARAS
jgi:hypothetical protein